MDITMQAYLDAKDIINIFETQMKYTHISGKINGNTRIEHVQQLLPLDSKFELTTRLKHVFRSYHIDRVKDLIGVTLTDYLNGRNIGEKTLKSIKTLYHELGLEL